MPAIKSRLDAGAPAFQSNAAHHRALAEDLREAKEDVPALGGRHEAPVFPRGLRRLDGAVDVSGGRAGELLDQLAGRGVQ